jgi:AcrR family transcriptional regulator
MSRDKIFAAARAVLDEEGISGVTVRKVSARAGVSPMAMYRHFTDKDALLNALMDDGLAAWEKIARALPALDAMGWLERLMEAFLNFALTQPHRFDAAFFLPAPDARQYPDDFVAGRSAVVALIIVRIDQAKADRRLGDKPALEIALTLSALAQGLVSMQRANRFSSETQFKKLFRTAMRHSLESFSAESSARSK